MTVADITISAPITDEARAAYVRGLRALAGILEASPEVPLPFDGRIEPVSFTFHFLVGEDPAAAMASASAAIGCPSWDTATRDYTDTGGSAYADLLGSLDGLRVRLTAYRDGTPDETPAETAAPAARARRRPSPKRAAAEAGAA